jgi:hypothetical protein
MAEHRLRAPKPNGTFSQTAKSSVCEIGDGRMEFGVRVKVRGGVRVR